MSERYSRLFALSENLYAVGSPVVIAAGTLLKDNQTGRIVAQLKFRSISSKTIKAVKVRLDLFDTAGSPIAESAVFDYLDLSASRDSEFGQKTPVPVPDNKARSYKAAVTEVVFADKSIWTATGGTWEPLSNPAPLTISDPELLKQYQLRFGSNSRYSPTEEKGLWYCTCGALNHSGETCHVCCNALFELQTVDMAALEAEKAARLERKAKQAAEEKAAAAIQKKKNKKTLRTVLAAACALIAFLILLNTVFIPSIRYNNAIELIKSGNIVKAYEMLVLLGDYKDCTTQADAIYEQYKLEKIKTATIGDSVFWGSYEQDNNTINGKEEIEWIVLDKADGKILVISKYILDCHPFNDILAEVTWEDCTLREWLNNDFFNTAFTPAEQKIIPIVQLSVHNNEKEYLLDGNVTQDRVFLLSVTEKDKYFPTKEGAQPTEYAIYNGAHYAVRNLDALQTAAVTERS